MDRNEFKEMRHAAALCIVDPGNMETNEEWRDTVRDAAVINAGYVLVPYRKTQILASELQTLENNGYEFDTSIAVRMVPKEHMDMAGRTECLQEDIKRAIIWGAGMIFLDMDYEGKEETTKILKAAREATELPFITRDMPPVARMAVENLYPDNVPLAVRIRATANDMEDVYNACSTYKVDYVQLLKKTDTRYVPLCKEADLCSPIPLCGPTILCDGDYKNMDSWDSLVISETLLEDAGNEIISTNPIWELGGSRTYKYGKSSIDVSMPATIADISHEYGKAKVWMGIYPHSPQSIIMEEARLASFKIGHDTMVAMIAERDAGKDTVTYEIISIGAETLDIPSEHLNTINGLLGWIQEYKIGLNGQLKDDIEKEFNFSPAYWHPHCIPTPATYPKEYGWIPRGALVPSNGVPVQITYSVSYAYSAITTKILCNASACYINGKWCWTDRGRLPSGMYVIAWRPESRFCSRGKNDWRAVDEGLPPICQDVKVCLEDGTLLYARIDARSKWISCEYCTELTNMDITAKPIAWRSIGEPYKTGFFPADACKEPENCACSIGTQNATLEWNYSYAGTPLESGEYLCTCMTGETKGRFVKILEYTSEGRWIVPGNPEFTPNLHVVAWAKASPV